MEEEEQNWGNAKKKLDKHKDAFLRYKREDGVW
jgi:hypothetical protein